ncbi:hypothetical protein AAE02nite_00450 [Adhaeribacter aerolatus]|uniref:CheC-like protein domain-containing protein n=1 Tax=Adhaeribacter aerolatus TaxID=670289 RepID=A0A512ARN2_9BACT|nr:hypothetical protein [Adhaeribacter aerolatus]GEO02381.1 hypothetical protein AAE02nite_00450 [Adhaeribacter aerolatus]
MYIIINELEKDVLREIISIGLARAADSFSNFSKSGVLLNVPEVKIIEPRVLPDVIDEFEAIYFVLRSGITGDLNGKTFMLFTEENIGKIAEVCLDQDLILGNAELQQKKNEMLREISQVVTEALANQLSQILKLNLTTTEPVHLFSNKAGSINHILEDLPGYQPFVITIKTQFNNLLKEVEIPMLVVFDSLSVSTLLRIIRRDNLYDYKLLKELT